MQPKEAVEQKSITRTEIAQWYGITERALRSRMQKAGLHIVNRILTKCDIRLIVQTLGEPQFIPPDLYKFYFVN